MTSPSQPVMLPRAAIASAGSNPAIEDAATVEAPAPLDGLAFGIDHLVGIVAVHLTDGRVHAAWVRADAGFSAVGIAPVLREAYRASHVALRAVADPTAADAVVQATMTIEAAGRLAVLSRVRGAIVGALFEPAMPLGMARLLTRRIAGSVEPTLPDVVVDLDAVPVPRPVTAPPPVGAGGSVMKNPDERGTKALAFPGFGKGSVPPPAMATDTIRWSPSRPPPPQMTVTEDGHAGRLLAYLEANAPEPHVARLRAALRAGLTPVALDHPNTLGADAMVLLETAVEEILGVDRAELRSLS